jgi:hypothetical protein
VKCSGSLPEELGSQVLQCRDEVERIIGKTIISDHFYDEYTGQAVNGPNHTSSCTEFLRRKLSIY